MAQGASAKTAPSALVRTLVSGRNHRSEGHAVALHRVSEDAATVTFGLDMSMAPVPQRRYAADLAALKYDGQDIKFIFGQSSLVGGAWDSALVIRMNPVSAKQLFESVDQMGNPSLAQIAEISGFTAEFLSEIRDEPRQTANMVANFAGIGVSGHETCIDLYHASAFAMRNLHESGALEVEPVVRVDIRTSIFMSIVSGLAKIVQQMTPLKQGASHG
jgi:hypothetical protein